MLARTSLIAAVTIAAALTVTATASAQLAPPAPYQDEEERESDTERDLDNSQSSDSKRGLEWLYVDVQGGMQIVGLKTLNLDETTFDANFIATEQEGFVLGAGVGVRLLFLTFGARARVGLFQAWDLFSVGGEAGFKIPLGNLEPHVELGAGYTALGSFKNSLQSGAVQSALDDTQIHGFYVRLGGGVDYYLTPMLSIGALASVEVLGLTRPGIHPDKVNEIKADPSLSTAQRAKADLLQLEGTSYGAAGTAMGVVGLHF